MISNAFKIGLTVVVFFALVAYHVVNLLRPVQVSSDWHSIATLFQLAGTVAGCYILLNTQSFTWLVLKFLRCRHFGGSYKGESKKVDSTPGGESAGGMVNTTVSNPLTVKFTIKHSFLEMTLTGKSYDAANQLVSSWNGVLFAINGDTHLFALQLQCAYGEFGVLSLTYDADDVHGVYWSGDQIRPGLFRIKAKRMA